MIVSVGFALPDEGNTAALAKKTIPEMVLRALGYTPTRRGELGEQLAWYLDPEAPEKPEAPEAPEPPEINVPKVPKPPRPPHLTVPKNAPAPQTTTQ